MVKSVNYWWSSLVRQFLSNRKIARCKGNSWENGENFGAVGTWRRRVEIPLKKLIRSDSPLSTTTALLNTELQLFLQPPFPEKNPLLKRPMTWQFPPE